MKSGIHLFVYGTLMFEEVWQTLVDGTYTATPARILNYRRTQVVDDVYPVIRPAATAKAVPGILYRDISSRDLRKLDEFEGIQYERRLVQALPAASFRPVRAQAYVLRDEFAHLASQAPWDPVKMRPQCGAEFVERRYGTATPEIPRYRRQPPQR